MGLFNSKAKIEKSLGLPFYLSIEYLQMTELEKDKYKEITLNWDDLGRICSIFGQTSIGEIYLEKIDVEIKGNITVIKCYAKDEEVLNRWLIYSAEDLSKILNLSLGHSVEKIEK